MIHEGWYMVQEAKLWYDYKIMVRSGNAVSEYQMFRTPPSPPVLLGMI